METLKTKFIHDQNNPVDKRKYKGFVHGVSTIFRTEGFGGIYKGVTATIIKQGSNQAVRFLVFGELNKRFLVNNGQGVMGSLSQLFCGALAGCISVLANNPIDVVKTQMQGLESAKYKNTWNCFTTIMKERGPLFFYKGVLPRMLRVGGDAAIVFTFYAKFSQLYDYVFPKKF